MVFCNRFIPKRFAFIQVFDFSKYPNTIENTYLLLCWIHCIDIFYNEFSFCETFTVKNFVTIILLIKILCVILEISSVDLPYYPTVNMYVLG